MMPENDNRPAGREKGNVADRVLKIGMAPSWIMTLPIKALICGVLLPFVVLEIILSGMYHRTILAVAGARDAVAVGRPGRSPKVVLPAVEESTRPRVLAPAPPAAHSRITARTQNGSDAIRARLPVFQSPATFLFRAARTALDDAVRRAAAVLRRVYIALIGFLGRTFDLVYLTPVRKTAFMVGLLVRAVDHRVRRTTLTISIEDTKVRMVVFRGRRVLSWRSAWAGDEFGPLTRVEDANGRQTRAQVTPDMLKRLIMGEDHRHGRVLADLPAYSSLIRNVTLTKVGRRYLGAIIEAEVLETVPFSKDQVDISWCVRPSTGNDKDQQEVLAVAVPKGEMEEAAALLSECGVSPSAAYAKSTSLASAVGVPDCLVIHFEDNLAFMFRVWDGETRVVHQIVLPRGEPTTQAAYDSLARGVEHVEGFIAGMPPASGSASSDTGVELGGTAVPVLITGDNFGAGIDVGALADVLQRPVSLLKEIPNAGARHLLDAPPDFPVAQYASNIGLLLADRAGTGPWKAAARKPQARRQSLPAGLDILPKRHRPAPLPVIPVLIFMALSMAAAGLVPITGLVNTVAGETRALEERLEFQQGQAKHRRAMVDRELELTEELNAVSAEAGALRARLNVTGNEMRNLLARIEAITDDSETHGVSLYGLNPETGGFAIAGSAETHGDVLRYAQAVRDSGLFADAQITGLEGLGTSAGGAITFRILAADPESRQEDEEQASNPIASDTPVITP